MRWARFSDNGYECSSKGDTRFSALFATLSDGRTIEEAYQLDVKGYRSITNDWRDAKGKRALRDITASQQWDEYLALWKRWVNENPADFADLITLSKGKVLTDRFANTSINQARALAEIISEKEKESKLPFDF